MPGRERLRLRGPVPPDRMAQEPPERVWTAKDDAVTLPRWLGLQAPAIAGSGWAGAGS
ncbi:hypothetical protein [Streptomyces sp. NPDC047453]|uniref:hypothetical protein n=1 Tax=Streptomyces sp. NPDC047453 TaxID=3154812 RepID=UPI0033EA13E9